MRRLLPASILTLSLVTASSAHADGWFRWDMSPVILFSGGSSDGAGGETGTPPDGGVNSNIDIHIDAEVNGRVYGTMNIPVSVSGVDATYSVTVADLPSGATWTADAETYGVGSIYWPSATQGTYHPTVEVRDADGALIASSDLEIIVYAPLTASVPQTSYGVEVGEPLVITPSVANLIADGAVQWGGNLPAWLDLNTADGKVTVDTSVVRSASDLVLTAVDQTDLKQASTQPFSVAVNGTCGAWTARPAPEQNDWRSVTYGNGKFVAVSYGKNRVMTSTNGVNWTALAVPEANGWQSVTYGGGQFVAVAYSGTNRIMTSTDGVTWAARAAPEANGWRSVTYGNGMFVAMADSGTNRIMTSTNGVNWTARAAPEQNNWYSVTYGNGQFVAVSSDGTNRIMTSPDGVNWTPRPSPEQNNWYSVTYGNGQFVAVAGSGTNRIMTSTDGVTWAARTASEANQWNSVTYGNGKFVAVASTGTNRIMTSSDGVNWTPRTAPEQNFWSSVTYGNGLFVATVSLGTGTRIMTSDCN